LPRLVARRGRVCHLCTRHEARRASLASATHEARRVPLPARLVPRHQQPRQYGRRVAHRQSRSRACLAIASAWQSRLESASPPPIGAQEDRGKRSTVERSLVFVCAPIRGRDAAIATRRLLVIRRALFSHWHTVQKAWSLCNGNSWEIWSLEFPRYM